MKKFNGTVVSDKMTNTVVVEVRKMWTHPLYKKTISRTKKYLAHDELGAKIGDGVEFVEVKPISKRKRFKVTKIIEGKKVS
jgi:small subunit ribosomal protein S17